ncbi:MAG: AI-2E family transporter [Sphingobacteriaceae bacterium]
MTIFNLKQRNTIVFIILIVLGAFLLYSLRIIAGALLSTLVLYTIFRPIFLFLIERWNWNRAISAVFIIISSLVIIILPFLALSMMVINKVTEFQQNPEVIQSLLNRFEAYVGSTFNIPHFLEKAVTKFNEYAGGLFSTVVGGAADIFLGLLVMYFLLYFMFTQYEAFEKGLLKYAPFKQADALKFATELRNTTYSNVLGQGFIALVQGSLVSVGFVIFGIPDAIFWGVIATFLSFLPIIGAPFVFIPAALIQLSNGHAGAGWGLLLWGLILITNIDNVIRFMIAKKVANTHPIITVIGVVIGIPIFGILGLVFGPLLLSYFILTFKIYENGKVSELAKQKETNTPI